VGGSLTGLLHLIRGLDRSRFAPELVLYEHKDLEADLRAMDLPVHYVSRRRVPKEHALLTAPGYHRAKAVAPVGGMLRGGRHALRLAVEEGPAALRLVRVMRRVRPDVVHLGNGVRANFDGVLACLLTRTPCLCHVKGFEKYSDRERWAASRIDALVPMTKAVGVHCAAHGVHGRHTCVVYDAVDESGFAPQRPASEVRAELGIKNGALCLGVVGNIQEWKGQAILVEALAQVVRAVPETHAFIVGGVHRAGAAYHARLQERIRELQLEKAISITGFRSDVADVVNALDVVVHTSVRPEPFGRVILEGMLLGKPVVATAAGGVPEMIRDGETGFLTTPGNAAELADRLITVLQDAALRRRAGEQAQAWAREQFSLEQHVAGMTAIYERLTERR
jgi:glycosyltransferase involved in cell wall biosynthesis